MAGFEFGALRSRHVADWLRGVAAPIDRLPLRVRPIPFVIVAGGIMAALVHPRDGGPAKNRSEALARALAREGLDCSETDIVWVSRPSGTMGALTQDAKALVRAHSRGEPNDLHLVKVGLSPEGVLLDVGGIYNLTRSSGVDESVPLVSEANPALVAYSASVDGVVTGLYTMSLAGKSPAEFADFTRVQRWQTAISNLQQTGARNGVIKNGFTLDPPVDAVELKFENTGGQTALVATADGHRIVIEPISGNVSEGAGWVRASPFVRARPGNLVTWTVDRVRGLPWFGEENMQVVKAIAFTAKEWLSRVGPNSGTGAAGEKAVAEEMGTLPPSEKVVFTDPELGFPPAGITPILAPPLPGEGKWIPLQDDPFIAHNAGLSTPFVTTFIRPDKQRPQTRIYVTLWDPRQVALHMEAGTVEPVSATGEAGPGVIPRTPEVMKHVVAGFNGGFQAMHGEFGMQASGVLYLPPKPYAATILEMKDGTTGFGSWSASSDVPDDVLSFRQNMTALIENGKHNPWGRTWWGGTPKGWADNIHTTRSAVCLTKESFVAYFWGHDTSAEALAGSMLAASCTYAVHLDMNPGLAGFEFYNVKADAAWTPLGRPLQQDWEFEGTFRDMPGFKYRARRMIKGMMHMNFPQYIQRDARDFFYLTLRTVLPGAEVAPAAGSPQPGEGAWRVKGLPQHGFPYALATTWVRFDPAHPDRKVRLLRVDPRAVQPARAEAGQSPTVLTVYGKRPKRGESSVYHARGYFAIGDAPADSAPLATGTPLKGTVAANVTTAVGVQDEDGMLVWAELAPETPRDDATVGALDALLASLGCGTRLSVTDGRALLGGAHDIAGEAVSAPADGLVARLVRAATPAARRVFDTPIVPPAVWQPLQSQRVRYFKKPSKPAPAASGSAAPSGSAGPTPPAPAPTTTANPPPRTGKPN